MIFTYSVSGARAAFDGGAVSEWVQAYLKEPGWQNRSLAAIVHGQKPRWEGPVELEIGSLIRVAGPGPMFRYPKDPEQWRADVENIAASLEDPEALPPVIVRSQPDGLHLSDGNHRVDALSLLGFRAAWALVWHDREPGCAGTWSPFAPEAAPVLGVAIDQAAERARMFLYANDEFLAPASAVFMSAEIDSRPIAALVLCPEESGLNLRSLYVLPEYRNRLLGTRLLRALATLGAEVRCTVPSHHAPLFVANGFIPSGAPNSFRLPLDERHR